MLLLQELIVHSHVQLDNIVMEAIGELNLATVARLVEPLREAEEANPNAGVTIDLRRVSYIDSAGLKLLLDARKRLSLRSRLLRVFLASDSQPARVMQTCRVEAIMTLVYE